MQRNGWNAETGEMNTTSQRIWNEMTKYSNPLRVGTIAELAGCSQSTARKHLRQWVLAGYTEETIATLPGRRRIKYVAEYEINLDNWSDTAPPIKWEDGGKLVYVTDPDDPDRYMMIDHTKTPPAVTHHERGTRSSAPATSPQETEEAMKRGS